MVCKLWKHSKIRAIMLRITNDLNVNEVTMLRNVAQRSPSSDPFGGNLVVLNCRPVEINLFHVILVVWVKSILDALNKLVKVDNRIHIRQQVFSEFGLHISECDDVR